MSIKARCAEAVGPIINSKNPIKLMTRKLLTIELEMNNPFFKVTYKTPK